MTLDPLSALCPTSLVDDFLSTADLSILNCDAASVPVGGFLISSRKGERSGRNPTHRLPQLSRHSSPGPHLLSDHWGHAVCSPRESQSRHLCERSEPGNAHADTLRGVVSPHPRANARCCLFVSVISCLFHCPDRNFCGVSTC